MAAMSFGSKILVGLFLGRSPTAFVPAVVPKSP
jgi:hypothetical protein